jgi:hypothetical protein
VTALVSDQNSLPLPGIRVDFGVTGPNARTGFAFTLGDGKAQFCYTGTATGTDSITSFVGTLSSNTVTKTWTAGSQMVCDVDGNQVVDMADLNAIIAARNTVAAPGDPRDANNDGVINVIDQRYCAQRLTP